MGKRAHNPVAIHRRIIDLMKQNPDGISAADMREALGIPANRQTHFDRRVRELSAWFIIHKTPSIIATEGRKFKALLYSYQGDRPIVTDEGQVSQRLRAEVIHAAHGRCQMCGRTIEQYGVVLVVDHKRPRDWGGTNDRDNLWAICEECNSGKKAYFSSFNAELMKKLTAHPSVHVRIGELLKTIGTGKRVPSALIDVVADQDDWQKRLRELRYPVIGWQIKTKLYKAPSGRKLCDYVLMSYSPWPEDPSGVIRRFEEERKKRNEEAGDV